MLLQIKMKIGDILKGKKGGRNKAFHFIVYLRNNTADSFIGTVLTHSNKYKDNFLTKKEHFKEYDPSGEKYKFTFENTHIVGKQFIKPRDWGPFSKVGELTKEGIRFVNSKINNNAPIYWDNYL